MDVRVYLLAIRKYWWLVLATVVIGTGAAAAYTFQKTPVYSSSVTFFAATPATDRGSALQGDQFGQDRVNTYVKLLNSDRVATLVQSGAAPELSLPRIESAISGSADLNTVLLTASVQDTDPQRALRMAGVLGQQFPQVVNDIETTGGTTTAPVKLVVVSGPTQDPGQVSPRKKLDMGLGFVLGLLLGLGIVILRAVLDTTVRIPDQLEEITGDNPLGVVPRDSAVKKRPLIIDAGRSVRAETYRQLRTSLQFVDVDSPVRVITVTSPNAGEGKSLTAANLAISFAELGRTVLLVEADLRRPRAADLLDVDRSRGLTNVLAGQVTLETATQQWGERLSFLPSGSIPPNPSELLASHQMSDLVARLREMYEIVILDTPPLLPVTDAAVATVHSDGAILVVRYGSTKRAAVARAYANLAAVDGRVLGTVLNGVPSRGVDAQVAYEGYAVDESLASMADVVIDEPVGASTEPDGRFDGGWVPGKTVDDVLNGDPGPALTRMSTADEEREPVAADDVPVDDPEREVTAAEHAVQAAAKHAAEVTAAEDAVRAAAKHASEVTAAEDAVQAAAKHAADGTAAEDALQGTADEDEVLGTAAEHSGGDEPVDDAEDAGGEDASEVEPAAVDGTSDGLPHHGAANVTDRAGTTNTGA